MTLEEIEKSLSVIAASQRTLTESIGQLAQIVSQFADAGNARMGRTEQELGELTKLVSQFIRSADARLTRIEENLDGLIRAITAEHSNGKTRG